MYVRVVCAERSKWGDVGGLSAARWSRVAPEGWGRGWVRWVVAGSVY